MVEYLGNSRADGFDGFGTTYVLDFTSFNSHSNSIANPGVCSNRLKDSFNGSTFNDWWTYSKCPSLPDQIGQMYEYFSYPQPSQYWEISMDSNNMIRYDGNFKLNELISCDSINIASNEKWLNVTGSFYINLVSPLSKSFDVGYYRIYQLYSAPFILAVHKTINVLSSTGISIFTITFVAVYKQQNGTYKLIMLTESADYLYLEPMEILSSPITYLDLISNDKTANGECVAVKNNICSQMFEITNNKNIKCAKNLFSGEYIIKFNVTCNPNIIDNNNAQQICHDWLGIHDNTIQLSTKLNWNDNICDTKTYLITFQGAMQFYTENTFDANSIQTTDGLYEIGIDSVYVKINLLNYADDSEIYNIIDITLANCWLCTTDPNNELTLDVNNGNGGCFSSALIDTDGPYHIIDDGEIATGYDDIDAEIYDDVDTNDVRFSFIVPSNIVRTKLYVHAQLNVDLIEIDNPIRRRIMIDIDQELNEMNQIKHYMNAIMLQKEINYLKHKLEEQNRNVYKWSYLWLSIVICVLIIAFIAIIFAIYVVIKNYKFKGKTFARYSIIKYLTDQYDDEQDNEEDENNVFINKWREIMEEQEKANSV
eukprot:252052_1